MWSPKFTLSKKVQSALKEIDALKSSLSELSFSEEWSSTMQLRMQPHMNHIASTGGGTTCIVPDFDKTQQNGYDAEKRLNQKITRYFDAFHYFSKKPLQESVSIDLIQEMHKLLMEGIDGAQTPGQFRTIQNYVWGLNKKIRTPPKPEEVMELMNGLISWLQKPKELHPLVVASLAQFQLIYIHPFIDGNGRTARLLATYCLAQSGYPLNLFFLISESIVKSWEEYLAVLEAVEQNGMELTPWLEYILSAIKNQLEEVLEPACV